MNSSEGILNILLLDMSTDYFYKTPNPTQAFDLNPLPPVCSFFSYFWAGPSNLPPSFSQACGLASSSYYISLSPHLHILASVCRHFMSSMQKELIVSPNCNLSARPVASLPSSLLGNCLTQITKVKNNVLYVYFRKHTLFNSIGFQYLGLRPQSSLPSS